jgi:hypothetical protein
VLLLGALLAGYLAGGVALVRYIATRHHITLLWSFAGSILIALAVIYVRADDVLFALLARTASGITTGPHLASAEIDWTGGVWLDWRDVVAIYEGRSVHVLLSPPGLPLIHALVNGGLDRLPAIANPLQLALLPYQCHNYALLSYTPGEWAGLWLGILMPVWAGLTVFPLYGLSRRLIGAGAAPWVALAWALVPAASLFAPTWNTFYPFVTIIGLSLFTGGLDRPLRVIAAGLLTGLLTFANFSTVPLVGLFGFYTVFQRFDLPTGQAWLRRVVIGLWFGLGLLLPWLIFGLASGLTPVDLLTFAMNEHLALDRPYLPWLWLHSWEWALFAGLPFVLLWLIGLRRAHGARQLGLALLATLIVLVLSGTARGETGRVWLFFAPVALIAAGGGLQGIGSRGWIAVSGAAAALLLALAATWAVIDAPDITSPPAPPGPVAANQPVNAIFADRFMLESWGAEHVDGVVRLHLNWRALEPLTTPYWFAALLVDPAGAPADVSTVWQPRDTRYPATCWRPGQVVGEVVDLPLPAGVPPGDWWISIAAFVDEADPEDRLPVLLTDGTRDTQLGLGPVTIGP